MAHFPRLCIQYWYTYSVLESQGANLVLGKPLIRVNTLYSSVAALGLMQRGSSGINMYKIVLYIQYN